MRTLWISILCYAAVVLFVWLILGHLSPLLGILLVNCVVLYCDSLYWCSLLLISCQLVLFCLSWLWFLLCCLLSIKYIYWYVFYLSLSTIFQLCRSGYLSLVLFWIQYILIMIPRTLYFMFCLSELWLLEIYNYGR